MAKCSYITSCRLCDSPYIKNLFSFGEVAPANNYILPENIDKPEEKFTLTPCRCEHCGHIQILETVDRESLFSNYLYASSTSGSLSKYFEKYAEELIEMLGLKPENGYILDIGSNDGVTLNHFKNKGFEVLGVEPASNLAKIAQDKDIPTINAFFDDNLAESIWMAHDKPQLIISNNTYAHIQDHHSFTNGVKYLLNESNFFVFENAHLLPTIKNLYFDQFYHDHLGYYWTYPLQNYFNNKDLSIFHVEKTPIQGGSIRVFVCLDGARSRNESVNKIMVEEIATGLNKQQTYTDFKLKIDEAKKIFEEKINEHIRNGKTISCYGAPAKFSTLSKFFELQKFGIEYVVDDSPFKQGLFSPESKIKIVSREDFIKNPTDISIITAWNFDAMIRDNNKQYSGEWVSLFKQYDL